MTAPEATTTTRSEPASRRALPRPGASLSPGAPGATMDFHHGLLDIRESVNLTRAVAELFNGNPHVLQDGRVEVCQWRSLGVTNVATTLDARSLPANECDRKVVVEMGIAVADAGP